MMRSRAWFGGLGLAALSGALVSLAACSSEDTPASGTGGSVGAGGKAGVGGGAASLGGAASFGGSAVGAGGASTTGSGGNAVASGGNASAGAACTATPLTEAKIVDFEAADSDTTTTDYNFGKTPGWAGGTYTYPAAKMTGTLETGTWKIAGNVGDYSGFGIWVGDGIKYDASAFTGIEFDISGNPGMDATGAPNKVTFSLGTAPNTWQDPTKIGCNTCVATEAARYSDCAPVTFAVPVSATKATIQIPWASLTGGKPVLTADNKQIVQLQWSFAWAGTGATAYDASIVIDNVRFTGGSSTTGSGGTGAGGGAAQGGSTAGGSTAGGSTSGGAAAQGGSTAGGSTAGGSTSGGAAAQGGSTAGGSSSGGTAAGGTAAGGSSSGGSSSGGTSGSGA